VPLFHDLILGNLVPEMTHNVSSATLNLTKLELKLLVISTYIRWTHFIADTGLASTSLTYVVTHLV